MRLPRSRAFPSHRTSYSKHNRPGGCWPQIGFGIHVLWFCGFWGGLSDASFWGPVNRLHQAPAGGCSPHAKGPHSNRSLGLPPCCLPSAPGLHPLLSSLLLPREAEGAQIGSARLTTFDPHITLHWTARVLATRGTVLGRQGLCVAHLWPLSAPSGPVLGPPHN